MASAHDALAALRAGNRRYLAGDLERCRPLGPDERKSSLDGQDPLAVVIGCSDSRVPVELLFDQGAGDLFVIRVAGNVIGCSQVGSIEYAVEQLGTRLVVVLGHTRCGAVNATLELQDRTDISVPKNLGTIVDRIRVAIQDLIASDLGRDPEELARAAVRENIRSVARELRENSEVISRLVASDGLVVLGAEYSLETGEVDFFDGLVECS